MITTTANPNYTPEAEVKAKSIISDLGRGLWDGSMVWWGDWSEDPRYLDLIERLKLARPSQDESKSLFTAAERQELKIQHGTTEVNWQRAADVKRAMLTGIDTLTALETKFEGIYGRTQLSVDLRALKFANSTYTPLPGGTKIKTT